MLKYVLFLLLLNLTSRVFAHPQYGWSDKDLVFVTKTRTHYSCPCDGSVTSEALPWLNPEGVWPTGPNEPHIGIDTQNWRNWNAASVSAILSTDVVTTLTTITVSGNPVTVVTTQTITYTNYPTASITTTSTTTPGGAIVSPILGSTTTPTTISQSIQLTATSNSGVVSPTLGSTTIVGTLVCPAPYITMVTTTYTSTIVYRGLSTTYFTSVVSSATSVNPACNNIPTFTPTPYTSTQIICPSPSVSVSTFVSTITYYSNGTPDRYDIATSSSIVEITPTCTTVLVTPILPITTSSANTNACTETPYYITYLSDFETVSTLVTPYCATNPPSSSPAIVSPTLISPSTSDCSAAYTTTYQTTVVSTYDYRGSNFTFASTYNTTGVVSSPCTCRTGTPYTTTYSVPQTTTYDYRGFTYTVSSTYTGTQTFSPSCDCVAPYTTSYQQYRLTTSTDASGGAHTYTTIYTGYEYVSPACSGRPDSTSTIDSGPPTTPTTTTASSTVPYAVLATFRVRGGPNGDIKSYADLGYIPTTSDTGYTNFNNATDLFTIDSRNQIIHLDTGHIAAVPGNTIPSHFLLSSPTYIMQNGLTILSCSISGYYDSGSISCDAGNGINEFSTQNGNLFIGPSVPSGYYSIVLHADVT